MLPWQTSMGLCKCDEQRSCEPERSGVSRVQLQHARNCRQFAIGRSCDRPRPKRPYPASAVCRFVIRSGDSPVATCIGRAAPFHGMMQTSIMLKTIVPTRPKASIPGRVTQNSCAKSRRYSGVGNYLAPNVTK